MKHAVAVVVALMSGFGFSSLFIQAALHVSCAVSVSLMSKSFEQTSLKFTLTLFQCRLGAYDV